MPARGLLLLLLLAPLFNRGRAKWWRPRLPCWRHCRCWSLDEEVPTLKIMSINAHKLESTPINGPLVRPEARKSPAVGCKLDQSVSSSKGNHDRR
jgi:hypothetical protein